MRIPRRTDTRPSVTDILPSWNIGAVPRLWRAALGTRDGTDASPRLREQFEQVEASGLRLAYWFRAVSMLAACLWIMARAPILATVHYLAIAAVIVLSGYAQALLARRNTRPRHVARYALILFDAALVTAAILLPNPAIPPDWPIAMQLRLGNFGFLLILLLLSGLTFSPATVLATGLSLAVCWSIGIGVILMQPGIVTVSREFLYSMTDVGEVLGLFLNPDFVSEVIWAQQIVILAILTLILAAIAVRSRRLANRQVRLAQERANLSRYFSPNLADALASSGETITQPKQHEAAVLFVDLVGFTRICEHLSPEDTLRLLQSYYSRTARTVFDHNGTLTKYIGDAVMATFGIMERDGRPATRALACAHTLLETTQRWNDKRREAGRFPIAMGIGIHYGGVLVGDAGDDRCREFAVLGSTVNLAARVERETRRLDRALIVTDDMVAAVRREGTAARLHGLQDLGLHAVRGRDLTIRLWGCQRLR